VHYNAIRYSKSLEASGRGDRFFGFFNRRPSRKKFSLGRKDGYVHYRTQPLYEAMLEEAKQIHIILQDTEDERAWQTNAERLILQIIRHRHALNPFWFNGGLVDISSGASVRLTMMKNIGKPMLSDLDIESNAPTVIKFEHLVRELFGMVEELVNRPQEAETAAAYWNRTQRHIQGWEYMDLVHKTARTKRREVEIAGTCGNWPVLAHDIEALILFGANFGDILQPKCTANLCANFHCLPRGNDFLAVEVRTLLTLYDRAGSSVDKEKLTITGVQWRRSQHLFESCPEKNRAAGPCKCDRIQELVLKGSNRYNRNLGSLEATGVVIFGKRGKFKNQVDKSNVAWQTDVGTNLFFIIQICLPLFRLEQAT
jgi:hypothetical protein